MALSYPNPSLSEMVEEGASSRDGSIRSSEAPSQRKQPPPPPPPPQQQQQPPPPLPKKMTVRQIVLTAM
jgi:hypothetical protein